MGLFEITALVLVLTAAFSYLNSRYIGLPTTIGVMVISLAVSIALLILGEFNPVFRTFAARLVESVDFNAALLHGMLAFLLFAAAQHLDLDDLLKEITPVVLLSVVGTVVSMFLIGGLAFGTMKLSGLPLPFDWCLLFGALISPTDPIAVIGMMRPLGAPPALETQIAGESLFNDGVGVVLFTVLLGTIGGNTPPTPLHIAAAVIWQSAGGIGIGFLFGFIINQMLMRVDNYKVELLLTLALAMGSYALADALGVSGPIATVVGGLMVGSQGRIYGMSEASRQNLDTFWELIDEVLNAVLFMLIGLEALALHWNWRFIVAALLCIPIALFARWISVAGIIRLLGTWRKLLPETVAILTWGGLRGGLSVAMALAIPPGPHRSTIVAMTYAIVVFSILVQGLTVRKLLNRIHRPRPTTIIAV
jgi:CPA1 family monovalent cation:H+ antiporter